jgi:uncharacterized phage infection (PIP) family protein YhgE
VAPKRLLAELFYDLRARTTGLQADLKTAESQFGKLSTFVKANPAAAVAALGTALASVAIKAAKAAAQMDGAFRQISAALPTGSQGIANLRNEVDELANASGRSAIELANAAREIARIGADSAEGVAERLRAATLAADATGEDLASTVQSLDKVMDTFSLSSADAEEALGKLFATARGRTSMTELADAIEAANPAIRRAGLDLDTVTRAITALLEEGRRAREIKTILGSLDAPGITALANRIPPVVDGLNKMRDAAAEVREGSDRLAERVKNNFSEVMRELGDSILPHVEADLQLILRTMDLIRGRGFNSRNFSQDAAGAAGVPGVASATFTTDPSVERQRRELEKQLADHVAANQQATDKLVEGSKRRAEAAKDAAKAEADAAKDARREVEALAERIGRLGSVQSLASGETRVSARAFRDLATELVLAATEFPQFSEQIALMSGRLTELQTAAASFEGAELARDIEVLLAAMTTTAVDDLELALKALQDRLRDSNATDEQIAQITALEEAFIRVKAQSEALDAALENGRAGGITPLREMVGLLEELRRAEEELQALESQGPEHDREKKELLEQIIKLKERIKELEEQNKEQTKDTTEATDKFAKSLSDAADIAYGLSVILLGSEATLTKMIAAVGRIADGFEDIANQGGFGAIFKDAESLAKALPALGQIIGGGITLGKLIFDDPNAEANRQATEKNTQALQRLTARAGDLVGVTTPGTTIAGIRAATASVRTDQGGVLGPVTVLRDWVAALKAAGVSMEDATEFAKQLGFDLTRFTVEGFKAFQDGLRDLDFKVFFKTFAGQLDRLSADFEIHGITDPIDQLVARAALLAEVAPSFAEIFEGLDLQTLEGRATAAKRLREQWDLFMENPEEFEKALEASGLSLDEWKQQMLEMNDALTDAAIAAARFNEAISDLELDFEIAGIDDPVARARGVAQAAAETDARFAPILGFDFNSAEGRAAAERFLQGLAAGADDETKQIIIDILRAIRAVPKEIVSEEEKRPGEVEIVGNAARGLTEVTGNRMADFLRTGLGYQRDTVILLEGILGAMGGGPALVQAPAFSASLGRGGGGSFAVNIAPGAVEVTVQGIAGANESTGQDIGDAAARRLARRLSEIFAEEARLTSKTLGRVVVSA